MGRSPAGPAAAESELGVPESPSFSGGRLAFVEEEAGTTAVTAATEAGPGVWELGEPAWDAAFATRRRSKLAKTLHGVLADPAALTHFLHYMHSRRMVPMPTTPRLLLKTDRIGF